ncbi:hypothetical protein BGY98DRAFT_1103135 [Russula aff. rugulosa BPL654]|nr:hypothetical protein BGY98DRAFT_1103135 [Russula aff. rugulosa BPL654]
MALPIPLPHHNSSIPSRDTNDPFNPRQDNFGLESNAAGPNTSHPYGQPDSDLDRDVYGQHLGPFVESLNGGALRHPISALWRISVYHWRDPYPAWEPNAISHFQDEIEEQQKLGFQRGIMWNMFDFTMHMLDGRASRMSPNQVHADSKRTTASVLCSQLISSMLSVILKTRSNSKRGRRNHLKILTSP